MVATIGLTGLRPNSKDAAAITCPPYDVIKPDSELEAYLSNELRSLYHITLGPNPQTALEHAQRQGWLIVEETPSYYVYEQTWSAGQRTGVLVAAETTPYEKGQVIAHEKTFDDKVRGRIKIRHSTGHTIGPVFVLTQAPISSVLDAVKNAANPIYDFVSKFDGHTELAGLRNRVWSVAQNSNMGKSIQNTLSQKPVYIADGHHRYHASLLNHQTHFLCYVTHNATIQAYNRVINGVGPFSEIATHLSLKPIDRWATPPKHRFNIYTRNGCYQFEACEVPDDIVGRLDCAILERQLYPHLGLTHDMISDPKHFDYYPESALQTMKDVVDRGDYDIAVALHPVSLDELITVANAGLEDSDIVMPEKSTFFTPKILSGLFLYRHACK